MKLLQNSFVQALIAFIVAFVIGMMIVGLFKEQILEQFIRFAPN